MDHLSSAIISDQSGGILGMLQARRRGEQGLSEWRDVTGRESSVHFEVSSGYVAAVVGSD